MSDDEEERQIPGELVLRRGDALRLAPDRGLTSGETAFGPVKGPLTLEEILPWSLWTFESSVWNGYVDFRDRGVYWTHWGFGHYSVEEHAILMVNDYDAYRHILTVKPDGTYEGKRSDRVVVRGRLLAIYHGPHRTG